MVSKERDVREKVREYYGGIAESNGCGCGCDCSPDSGPSEQVIKMYDAPDVATLPQEVTDLSLGCGDPVTLASLEQGQTVLDLGSGAGIDCFLAARRVGETGHVIGVDMTASMLVKARANKEKIGADNVEFRMGEIEHLPVADTTVDVIISNCVINLSPDKPQVFREAFRVLKPGGRLAVSDIMTDGPLLPELRESLGAWASCIGGALEESDYIDAIEAAGFEDVTVERQYFDDQTVRQTLDELGIKEDGKARAVVVIGDEKRVIELDRPVDEYARTRAFSGRVTARKPR